MKASDMPADAVRAVRRALPERRSDTASGLAIVAVAAAIAGCGGSGTTTSAQTTAPPTPPPTSNSQTRPARPAPSVPAAQPLGRRTKTSGCQASGQLPDPACTPGSVFPAATVAVICRPGYTATVRNVSDETKNLVYAEYGVATHAPRSYEVDHLVPLELGGDNSLANLWPEPSPGYGEKDDLENRLHDAVCTGSAGLRAVQRQIARDWRHTSVGSSAAGITPPAASTPTQPPPASTQAASGFCDTHQCIPSFGEGHGTIVQCADGMWSHSGGEPGVCSRHGGAR